MYYTIEYSFYTKVFPPVYSSKFIIIVNRERKFLLSDREKCPDFQQVGKQVSYVTRDEAYSYLVCISPSPRSLKKLPPMQGSYQYSLSLILKNKFLMLNSLLPTSLFW